MTLKHNLSIGFTTISMMIFMTVCKAIGLPESEWSKIECIVFGWVERDHN